MIDYILQSTLSDIAARHVDSFGFICPDFEISEDLCLHVDTMDVNVKCTEKFNTGISSRKKKCLSFSG